MIILSAFFMVVAIIPLICRIAERAGFVDTPQGRKQHHAPVPPLGGAVIFSVFLIFMMVYAHLPWAVISALALILVVGIVDDAWEVNAKFKFAIHFAAAFMLVIGSGAQLHSLGNLLGLGTIELGWFAIPFSVACVVYIQNAINMMDGVDGLAGGNSFLIFAWLLFAAISGGNSDAAFQLGLLMACLGGFLVYNMRSPILKQAKIFLGDAGSMALGLMIAWYSMTLSQDEHAVIAPASVAWILALPIVDSFGLLVTRLKERRPPFEPDARHFHHHFAHAGFAPGSSAVLIIFYSFCLGAIGMFGIRYGLSEPILGWTWIALWWGHAAMTLWPTQFIRLLCALNRVWPLKTQHQ